MLQKQLLQALCYFDIFQHPLKIEELRNFCNEEITQEEVELEVENLYKERKVYFHKAYVSINQNIKELTEQRKEKEKMAQAYFKKLPFFLKIIRAFPFVRAVAISGSLSKNVMHKNGDIDYFIITAKDRLWICRTLLILFKKIFLLNSRKYFCLNYFVDEDNLEIIDKNIFTAIEVTHLLPVHNPNLIESMKERNSWTKKYFSAFQQKLDLKLKPQKVKKTNILEMLFSGKFGDYLDLYLMKITHRHWQRKFKNFSYEKLQLTMRSNRGVSKHHPHDFQTKVLAEFNLRWEKFFSEELSKQLSHEHSLHA